MKITKCINLCFISIIFLLVSCNNHSETTEDVDSSITVQLDYEDSNLSEMPEYTEIKLVPLETNNKSLIGGINKILCTKNRIYILDTFSAEAVFVFDTDGSLIKVIKTVGRGPSEYVMITDIGFDQFNMELVIVDPQLSKVLRYDENGDFKSELFFDFGPNMVGFIDKNTYSFKTNTETGPVIKTIQHDGQNEQIVHHLTFELNLSNFFYLPNYQGNQYFFENFKDTIWQINAKRMTPYLYVDFMDRKLSREDYQNLIQHTKEFRNIPFLPKNKAGQIDVFLESQKYIQFFCRNLKNRTLVLIKKDSSKVQNIANSCDHRQNPLAQIIYSVNTVDPNGNFVGYIPADRYLDLIETEQFKSLSSKGKITIENVGYENQGTIEITSNPIIAYLKL